MKNFIILLCALSLFFPKLTHASAISNPSTSATEVIAQSKFKAQNAFIELRQEQKTEKKLERKLSFATKLVKIFGLNKLEQRFFEKTAAGTDSDKVVGILLGFLLGLLGVLIAYIIGNSTITRNAWRGFGILILLLLIVLALRK